MSVQVQKPLNQTGPLSLDPILSKGMHALVGQARAGKFSFHPRSPFAVAGMNDDRAARNEFAEHFGDVVSAAGIIDGALAWTQVVIQRDQDDTFQAFR